MTELKSVERCLLCNGEVHIGYESFDVKGNVVICHSCVVKERDELKQLVFECFNQACQIQPHTHPDGVKYDHSCHSTYEEAQAYLLEHGMIKKKECYRK